MSHQILGDAGKYVYLVRENMLNMNKVYKTSGFTKVVIALGFLLSLLFVGVFINIFINPDPDPEQGGRIVGIIFIGIVMLVFVSMTFLCLLGIKDNVVLTDKGIRLHLHRQTFPLKSLKPIDDEVAWKDIKKVSFVEKEQFTFLVLKLSDGEVKEYGIGHLEKRLKLDIEDFFYSGIDIDDEARIKAEEEIEGDPNQPGTLEWSKKKKFRQVLLCALVELIGIALIAVKQRWGILLVFPALILGLGFIYQYYLYNSLHSSPALARKGRKTIALSGLLLVALLVVSFLVSDATLPASN